MGWRRLDKITYRYIQKQEMQEILYRLLLVGFVTLLVVLSVVAARDDRLRYTGGCIYIPPDVTPQYNKKSGLVLTPEIWEYTLATRAKAARLIKGLYIFAVSFAMLPIVLELVYAGRRYKKCKSIKKYCMCRCMGTHKKKSIGKTSYYVVLEHPETKQELQLKIPNRHRKRFFYGTYLLAAAPQDADVPLVVFNMKIEPDAAK